MADVAEAVGSTLAGLGVRQAFGVVGSGNFHVTNALRRHGVGFVAARHEGGAATMADAYARTSRTVSVLTVHQGCGLTNAMTGITEAAKSRTPMITVAAAVTQPRSNFYVDQSALATAVGAVPFTVASPETAVETTTRAFRTAWLDRRTVLLNLPLAVQTQDVGDVPAAGTVETPAPVQPSAVDADALAEAIRRARRPVFVAGRGARVPGGREALASLADSAGALLATSAVAKGLFHGNPWSLDVSGGFASPLAAELIRDADLIVGWGCALNMWTMRHGALIGPDATVVQVDVEPDALGVQRTIDRGVVGDVAATARAVDERLGVLPRPGYRDEAVRSRIERELRWRDVAYDDLSTADTIDPRTLTAALDDLLPAERVIGVDSGNFMGYPSMYLSVPDEEGFCFTQAFQSVGLGLATTIGAALARPDRLPVAALGDGGALMGASELETVVRLRLPMVVVVYDDEEYGAEVHHFGPDGHDLATVRFPPADVAAIARGYGFEAVTVRQVGDLDGVRRWVDSEHAAPLLIDAKVTRDVPSWWLEEAFRGH